MQIPWTFCTEHIRY